MSHAFSELRRIALPSVSEIQLLTDDQLDQLLTICGWRCFKRVNSYTEMLLSLYLAERFGRKRDGGLCVAFAQRDSCASFDNLADTLAALDYSVYRSNRDQSRVVAVAWRTVANIVIV